VLAEPDLVTPADPNATSSLYSRGINHAADSLSPRLAAHLASHLGPYVPGNHAIQSVLVASGFHCLDVFATLRTGVGDDDDLANLEDEVRREVVAHGTYCGIRDPGWRLKVGQRRTIQFAVNAATEAARASARPEKGVGEVEGRARAARKRALGSVPEEDEEAESSAEAPRALESPPQRSPLRRPSVRRRSVPEIGQDTDAVACRVAYRSGGGGGSAGKVHALADVSLDSELRNRLLNVLRECLESRRLPWVAGRDYSLVFSISPRPGAGKWERGVGAGPSASVVCKCGTSLKLWYPNAEKRLKMSTFLRHLKERCSAVKSEMVAVRVNAGKREVSAVRAKSDADVLLEKGRAVKVEFDARGSLEAGAACKYGSSSTLEAE